MSGGEPVGWGKARTVPPRVRQGPRCAAPAPVQRLRHMRRHVSRQGGRQARLGKGGRGVERHRCARPGEAGGSRSRSANMRWSAGTGRQGVSEGPATYRHSKPRARASGLGRWPSHQLALHRNTQRRAPQAAASTGKRAAGDSPARPDQCGRSRLRGSIGAGTELLISVWGGKRASTLGARPFMHSSNHVNARSTARCAALTCSGRAAGAELRGEQALRAPQDRQWAAVRQPLFGRRPGEAQDGPSAARRPVQPSRKLRRGPGCIDRQQGRERRRLPRPQSGSWLASTAPTDCGPASRSLHGCRCPSSLYSAVCARTRAHSSIRKPTRCREHCACAAALPELPPPAQRLQAGAARSGRSGRRPERRPGPLPHQTLGPSRFSTSHPSWLCCRRCARPPGSSWPGPRRSCVACSSCAGWQPRRATSCSSSRSCASAPARP